MGSAGTQWAVAVWGVFCMATTAPDNQPSSTASGRLISVDALRGFDMFWIIGGGEVFSELVKVRQNWFTLTLQEQLEHVSWQGCHFEDLIYPLFLFIIGIVLPFSLARRQEQGQSLVNLYLHCLKRSLLLILLGSIPGGLLSFTHGPFMGGVLAHIGLCYFFAAVLVIHTGWRTRAGIVAGYLICYWLASILIPVPGSGAGVFTEEGSLASYIDRHFISGGLWNEGPASTPSGISIILWGSLAGHWLRSARSGHEKAAGLALLGLASVILGSLWSLSFPMIKRVVWSSSYVAYACGWSLLLLAIFYWVIDVKGCRRWSFFFIVIGMNAITIYFLQSIVSFDGIAKLFVQGVAERSGACKPLILPLGVVAVKWSLLWFLYHRRIFFKL
jgi:predicted acyltransferase